MPKSAIMNFVERLKALERNAKAMKSSHIIVGWADEAKEQKRAKPKAVALAINADRASKKRKGKGEIVSNFDENFVGPGIQAASLATIAKVMNYGRAGGVNQKTGKPYGAIPARPFVKILQEKHMKPILNELRKVAGVALDKNAAPTDAHESVVRLAVTCKGQLQRAMMDSNQYAPNAPITINGGWMANVKNGKPFKVEPKGSSRPLWNTGTLIKSVDFEIK